MDATLDGGDRYPSGDPAKLRSPLKCLPFRVGRWRFGPRERDRVATVRRWPLARHADVEDQGPGEGVDKTLLLVEPTWSGNRMITKTILIVDDDPGTLRLLGSLLGGVGRIRIATNGKDALRLAREAIPDLILLDGEMPDMTGFEVYECLKVDRDCADVPVMFVSSHGEAAFEVAGLGVDFIEKPIEPEATLARVKNAIDAGCRHRAETGSAIAS
jgi:CheY-like chemotaxis protein